MFSQHFVAFDICHFCQSSTLEPFLMFVSHSKMESSF